MCVCVVCEILLVLQAIEQERAKKEVALEAELRRSIETSLAERVRQEKLNLSRKALEMGKQKVPSCAAHLPFTSLFIQSAVLHCPQRPIMLSS